MARVRLLGPVMHRGRHQDAGTELEVDDELALSLDDRGLAEIVDAPAPMTIDATYEPPLDAVEAEEPTAPQLPRSSRKRR